MLSKLMRYNENCIAWSQHWSTEWAQFFSMTTPDHTLHNSHFKSWMNGATKFCLIHRIHLTSYFFKHLDTFLKGKHFHNQQGAENAFQVFAKSWITNFYSMRISKLNFSAKMFDYIFWLIKIHLSLVKMI